jgi:hypothetical protein
MSTFSDIIRLDEESMQSLERLIGITRWRILTPCIQVAGPHITSPSFSIPRGPQAYSAISCAWFETPHTFSDYWRLSVTEAPSPMGIDVRSDGAIIAPCTINLFQVTPISLIEIYSSRWEWASGEAEERVEWDSALLMHLQDRQRFCVWCQLDGPGIATEVSFTQSPDLIAEVLKEATLRMRIE